MLGKSSSSSGSSKSIRIAWIITFEEILFPECGWKRSTRLGCYLGCGGHNEGFETRGRQVINTREGVGNPRAHNLSGSTVSDTARLQADDLGHFIVETTAKLQFSCTVSGMERTLAEE